MSDPWRLDGRVALVNGSLAVVADVTDPGEVARVVGVAGELGDLHVLVAAAGTNRPGPARDYPVADWDLLST